MCAYLRATAPSTPSVDRNGVASAFDGELHDVFGIEVHRVRRERCSGRMFDSLVHRKNRNVTRPRQTAGIEQLLQIHQRARRAVRRRHARDR